MRSKISRVSLNQFINFYFQDPKNWEWLAMYWSWTENVALWRNFILNIFIKLYIIKTFKISLMNPKKLLQILQSQFNYRTLPVAPLNAKDIFKWKLKERRPLTFFSIISLKYLNLFLAQYLIRLLYELHRFSCFHFLR